jgi:hypothetical protein
MMFGNPIARETKDFGVPGKVGRIRQRLGDAAAFDDWHKIE